MCISVSMSLHAYTRMCVCVCIMHGGTFMSVHAHTCGGRNFV